MRGGAHCVHFLSFGIETCPSRLPTEADRARAFTREAIPLVTLCPTGKALELMVGTACECHVGHSGRLCALGNLAHWSCDAVVVEELPGGTRVYLFSCDSCLTSSSLSTGL